MQFPSLYSDVAEGNRLERDWSRLRDYLRSPAGDLLVDEAVLGGLPNYEAEELLGDYGIPVTGETLHRLGQEIDRAVTDA